MFTRSQQISSPLLLPLLGSILTTSVIATIFLLPPSRPTLSLQQLLLRAALDLTVAACIHVVTVWTIWRLVREYLEPSAGTLAIHIWAAVAWLPLITILSAERSLWISCVVPWAFANAIIFLNLWSALRQDDEPEAPTGHSLFNVVPVLPLWRILLPYCITILTVQAGLTFLAFGHTWSAAALFSAGVLLFLVRHPFVSSTAKSRHRFSRSSILQTASVFFLITTALTPFLQKAYGLRSLASLLATMPAPITKPTFAHAPSSDYSGVILTLPPKPHPPVEPPTRSKQSNGSTALSKPVIIPFDGVYWYFKSPDTRPRPGARVQHGIPSKLTCVRQIFMRSPWKPIRPFPIPSPPTVATRCALTCSMVTTAQASSGSSFCLRTPLANPPPRSSSEAFRSPQASFNTFHWTVRPSMSSSAFNCQ